MSAPTTSATLPESVRRDLWALLHATDRLVLDQHHDGIGIVDSDGDLTQASPEQMHALVVARDLGLVQNTATDDLDFALFGDEQIRPTDAGHAALVALDEQFGGVR